MNIATQMKLILHYLEYRIKLLERILKGFVIWLINTPLINKASKAFLKSFFSVLAFLFFI